MSKSEKPEKTDGVSVPDDGDNTLIRIDSPGGRKLVRTLVNGLGAVVGPAFRARMEAGRIRRIADAEADAIRKRAKAEKDAIEMLGAERAREIVTTVQAADAIRQRANERMSFQEEKRQNNIEAVAWQAAQKTPENVSEEPVHPDWIARFFESVKDVSDETMQKMWSSVLAGEVEQPGQTSLRTLEVLKSVSQREAEMFARLTRFVILGHRVFYPRSSVWRDKNMADRILKYREKLLLQECGLIQHDFNSVMYVYRDGTLINPGGFALRTMPKTPDEKFKLAIPVIRLSRSGMEIFRFIGPEFPEVWYVRAFAEFLNSHKMEIQSGKSTPAGWENLGAIHPSMSDDEIREIIRNSPLDTPDARH